MIRLALFVLLVGCASDEDTGTPLPSCQECGPGAIRGGRFFPSTRLGPIIANRAGKVLAALDDRFVWVRDDFTLEHSMWSDYDDFKIAIDGAGGGVLALLPDPTDPSGAMNPKTVIALAPDHTERWKVPLGVLGIAGVAASSDMIVLDVWRGGGPTLVALRVADGSMAWSKSLGTVGAFAPDGTLIVTGTFSGTLDLGGTTTPLVATGTDVYVAAADALTGEARWAVRLDVADDKQNIPAVGVGSAGEVAVWWYPQGTGPSALTLLDAAGAVRWTQPFDGGTTALLPDGDRVLTTRVTSSEVAIAQYSAGSLDWQRPVTGGGAVKLLALAGGRLIGAITNGSFDTPMPSTTVGDVTVDGGGMAIVEFAQ